MAISSPSIVSVFLITGIKTSKILIIDLLLKKPDMWIDFIHPGDKERILFELKTAASDKIYREFDLRLIQNEIPMWLKFQLFPIERASKTSSALRLFL